jgi:hypothetical protein
VVDRIGRDDEDRRKFRPRRCAVPEATSSEARCDRKRREVESVRVPPLSDTGRSGDDLGELLQTAQNRGRPHPAPQFERIGHGSFARNRLVGPALAQSYLCGFGSSALAASRAVSIFSSRSAPTANERAVAGGPLGPQNSDAPPRSMIGTQAIERQRHAAADAGARSPRHRREVFDARNRSDPATGG